jgi:CRP-like cAMP-binding protein
MELPAEFANGLHGQINIRHVAPGEGIIRAGDQGDSLFWVLSGSLSIVQPESRTEPFSGIYWHTLEELHAGDWFGEASLLTGAPRRSTVVAVTACDLAEITKEAFESVLQNDSQVIERLANIMMKRRRPLPDAVPQTVSHLDYWRSVIRTWFGMDG